MEELLGNLGQNRTGLLFKTFTLTLFRKESLLPSPVNNLYQIIFSSKSGFQNRFSAIIPQSSLVFSQPQTL